MRARSRASSASAAAELLHRLVERPRDGAELVVAVVERGRREVAAAYRSATLGDRAHAPADRRARAPRRAARADEQPTPSAAERRARAPSRSCSRDVGQRQRQPHERRAAGCVTGTATYSMSMSERRAVAPRRGRRRACARRRISGPLRVVLERGERRAASRSESPTTRAVGGDERDARADQRADAVGLGVELAAGSGGVARASSLGGQPRLGDERLLDALRRSAAASTATTSTSPTASADSAPTANDGEERACARTRQRHAPGSSELVAELLDGHDARRPAAAASRAGAGRGRRRCACRPCSGSPRRRSAAGRATARGRDARSRYCSSRNSFAVSVTSSPSTRDDVALDVDRRSGRSVSGCAGAGARCARRSSARDARDQLVRAERLGDVVVGAELEPDDAVGFLGARRQHDDRHCGRGRIGAQRVADLEAVDARQHQVEHQRDPAGSRRSVGSTSAPRRNAIDGEARARRGCGRGASRYRGRLRRRAHVWSDWIGS